MSGTSKSPGPGSSPSFDPPPGWGPQRPWVSDVRRRRRSFTLAGLAILAIAAVTVGAVAISSRDEATTSGAAPDTSETGIPSITVASPDTGSNSASAGDVGPVAIVGDDPTCEAWLPIGTALTAAQIGAATDRLTAMRTAADQLLPLAAQTPHRTMRELYEQNHAYLQLASEQNPRLPTSGAAQVTGFLSAALTSICDAVT